MELIHSLAESYKEGGWGMHLILACSLAGAAITFERVGYIMGAARVKKDELLNTINRYVMQGNLDGALQVCKQAKSPLTNIIGAGLLSVANSKDPEEVQTAMDAAALREIPKLEKRIGLLAMLSNAATLFGLLGTIVGLIGAFGAVANVTPSEKATLLANSISEAMNCTAFGLLVAIPLLIVYGLLQSKTQEIVDDIHEASVATLNFILVNKDKFQNNGQGHKKSSNG
jgi:biopolymer transport protein ExbB/TolQ